MRRLPALTFRLNTQSVELTCKCRTPANPDKTLIGCTSPDCGSWLHLECLRHDVLVQVYESLGTDKPHKSEKTEELPVKVETEATRPLTPNKNNGEESPPSAADGGGPRENGNGLLPPREVQATTQATTQTPTPGPTNPPISRIPKTASGKKGRPRKVDEKPYEGLFKAELRMSDGPMMWEITDLRPDIEGGERTWTERAACLLCKNIVD